MIQFPYGIADFRRIRQQGRVYVDRTAHIRDVEMLGDVLVFLRPRRFGKSLWLQTLANYYDLRRRDEFDELFGDLAIGREPTPHRNRYFVLQWNFSTVSASGGVEQIDENLRKHVRAQAKVFAKQYKATLPEPIEVDGNSAEILSSLLNVVSKTPYKLYLLIDEYDHFINALLPALSPPKETKAVQDVGTYHDLSGKVGPYKQLFKSVKAATEGQGLERVFVTGVSPIALNVLRSGFNIAQDVSLEPALSSLCGFRGEEIGNLLERIAAERSLSPETVDQAAGIMRTWYAGYRFSRRTAEDIYNPTHALYYLKSFCRDGKSPEELLDKNLRADPAKLTFIAQTSAGAKVVEKLAEGDDGSIDVWRLGKSFPLAELATRLEKDTNAVASFLYYMGLLTQTDVPFRLRIPNLVVRKLFLKRLLEIFPPGTCGADASQEIGEAPSTSGWNQNLDRQVFRSPL